MWKRTDDAQSVKTNGTPIARVHHVRTRLRPIMYCTCAHNSSTYQSLSASSYRRLNNARTREASMDVSPAAARVRTSGRD